MSDKQDGNESLDTLQEWLKKRRKTDAEKTDAGKSAASLKPVKDKDRLIEYLAGVINRQRQKERKTNVKMYTDPDTGHLNVNACHEALEHAIEKHLIDLSQNKTPSPTTVAIIDLNYLKPINNQSYEGCGNVAIRYLINYISKNLRTNVQNTAAGKNQSVDGEAPDIIGHLKTPESNTNDHLVTRMSGGDEFAVIMRGCDVETAKNRLNTILENMAKDSLHSKTPCIGIDTKNRKVPIQVSAAVGYAQLPNELPNTNETFAEKIASIKSNVLKTAGDNEKFNKESSKKQASEIENGFPYAGTRADAELILGNFFEKRIQEFNNGDHIQTTPIDIKTPERVQPDYSAGQRVATLDNKFPDSPNIMLGDVSRFAPATAKATQTKY